MRLSLKSETNIEVALEKALIEEGFVLDKDFFAQKSLRSGHILDFYFPDKKLAVETDGEAWHSSKKAKKRDRWKDYCIKRLGMSILRFSGTEIMENAKKCAIIIKEK